MQRARSRQPSSLSPKLSTSRNSLCSRYRRSALLDRLPIKQANGQQAASAAARHRFPIDFSHGCPPFLCKSAHAAGPHAFICMSTPCALRPVRVQIPARYTPPPAPAGIPAQSLRLTSPAIRPTPSAPHLPPSCFRPPASASSCTSLLGTFRLAPGACPERITGALAPASRAVMPPPTPSIERDQAGTRPGRSRTRQEQEHGGTGPGGDRNQPGSRCRQAGSSRRPAPHREVRGDQRQIIRTAPIAVRVFGLAA